MRVSFLLPLVALFVILSGGLGFAAEGIFQGTVVDPPASQSASPGWIFVEGGNHLLRRVEVSHAAIVFGPAVPWSQRRKCGPECLAAGQEVRVIAEQDASGEWRARQVEILRISADRRLEMTTYSHSPSGPVNWTDNTGFRGICARSNLAFTKLNSVAVSKCLDNQRLLAQHLTQHGEIPQHMVIRDYNDQKTQDRVT